MSKSTAKNFCIGVLSILTCTLFFLSSCTLSLSPEAQAGKYKISGCVLDKKGSPVSGVTISLVDHSVSAITDSSGNYLIETVPGVTVTMLARLSGKVFIPQFTFPGSSAYSSTVEVSSVALEGTVSNANFLAVSPDTVTIPMIQGCGARSPLVGQEVSNITGIVTMITLKTAHSIYDTLLYDSRTTPQWISEDGFFMEAVGSDKDGNPLSSDGIFVSTHNPLFTESKWKDNIATDLKPGDIVVVSGIVEERRPIDRFNNSTAYLSRTVLNASVAIARTDANGSHQTSPFPDGVLLSYTAPVTGEYRVLPWNDTSSVSLQNAINIFESVEGMFIRINAPLVTGSTYYNITGVMADAGKNGGSYSGTFNSEWFGPVLAENDFNTEILYVDYQSPDWKTFQSIPQVGDILKDSTGAEVFRGVMDYTADAIYMARPLQLSSPLISLSSSTIPSQGWDFNNTYTWYDAAIKTSLKTFATADRTKVADWRRGASADPKFKAPWVSSETDVLTVASFNIENYVNQGKPNAKDIDVAKIISGNLKSPDVVVIVEMGDDNTTSAIYANQADSYSFKDGVVSAVQNYRGLITTIKTESGITYDFRQIDPKENDSGGAPGVNIRVGFLFRTDRVSFVDRGMVTNSYGNTGGASSSWPIIAPGAVADVLAEANSGVYSDATGPHLAQSPGYIQDSSFKRSRLPLAGEFTFGPKKIPFFVVAAHLSSKGGDLPLYGEIQPPLLKSESGRIRQAVAVNRFVTKILSADENARVIVAGDMNDFGYSLPLKTLTGENGARTVLYSPSEQFMPQNERFSYSFRGNLQQIDHILVSPILFNAMRAEGFANWKNVCYIPHINSVFSRNNKIPTSDHDPEIVRLKGAW